MCFSKSYSIFLYLKLEGLSKWSSDSILTMPPKVKGLTKRQSQKRIMKIKQYNRKCENQQKERHKISEEVFKQILEDGRKMQSIGWLIFY